LISNGQPFFGEPIDIFLWCSFLAQCEITFCFGVSDVRGRNVELPHEGLADLHEFKWLCSFDCENQGIKMIVWVFLILLLFSLVQLVFILLNLLPDSCEVWQWLIVFSSDGFKI
jgi:hypothetical protein